MVEEHGSQRTSEAQPVPNEQTRDEQLTCFHCGHDRELERAVTRYGRVVIRCRDVIACDRRYRSKGGTA